MAPNRLTGQRLSLWAKLDILTALPLIALTAVWAMVTGFFRGEKQPPAFLLHVAYAVMRKATTRLTPLQLQFISPPTNKMYLRYARSAHFKPESVPLGNGAQGHWIGDKNAKNVLIWYHGGGFCLPANIGYFKFLHRLVTDCEQSGKSVAVFMLTYSLAPHATYPAQLIQAVDCLRYIVTQTGRSPSNVFLGGDSAGGNLAVGVLSHLAHPHPRIKELKISEPLAGVATIAPWTSLDTYPGQKVDCSGDLITPFVAEPWSRAYLGNATRDYYTDVVTAPASWFATFPVKTILVCGGGNEIMLPFIQDFVDKLKAGYPNVEFCIGKREGHVAPVYNLYAGYNKETEQGKRVRMWLTDLM